MHRYPYGGHPRFAQYLAPAICLLLGLGGSAIIAWVARRGTPATLLRCTFALLALVALGSMVRDFRHPYKSPTDLRYRDFARWFWWTAEYDGEAVCLKTDLGLPLSKEAFHALNWSAMYLCNQRIYSPRHARGEPPRWDRVTAQNPLRCVQFWVPRCDYDQAGFDRWMADMQSRYELLSTDRYAFPCLGKNDGLLENLDYVLVYKFGPKEEVASSQLPVAGGQ
jgi:hypothetical protein